MKLPEPQALVLEVVSSSDSKSIAEVSAETGLDEAVVSGAVFSLEEQGLVELSESVSVSFRLTAEGESYVSEGLPECRLFEAARSLGAGESAVSFGRAVDEAGLGGAQVDIAISNFARKGYGSVADGEIAIDTSVSIGDDPEQHALAMIEDGEGATVDEEVISVLERRNLVEREDNVTRSVLLTDAGVTALMEGVEAVSRVDRLTPEQLTSGAWESVDFASYNVSADAGRVFDGNVHILRQAAEQVKDVLVGMGFKEMEGPHADAQFWINDCLFMPQDHPARTHWDQFEVELPPSEDISTDLMERVKSVHLEGTGPDGDGYHSPWDESVARRIDLRGHTTSLSMRYLAGYQIGELDPPERYFSVEKVYRNDTLDPTHLLEFFQIEGWVMAEELSVRDLMGTFTEFYAQFGITDLEFKPHYNPYTEPSFELFGRHPETDELIEIGNSGMFRDEVLRPLGVECDVMAWGLALERLLMLMYGFDDIRDVHGTLCDLALLRDVEVIS